MLALGLLARGIMQVLGAKHPGEQSQIKVSLQGEESPKGTYTLGVDWGMEGQEAPCLSW